MATSGVYNFNLSCSELLIDSTERAGKNFATLTQEEIRSAVRSMNLVLVLWANRGINLWTVTEFSSFMPQGVAVYTVPPEVVDVLADSVILRQYQMGQATSVAPAFTTTIGSASVTISGLPATPAAGQYLNVAVMVSVGGIILDGFYQVVSVPGSGQATVTAASAATASVTNGGVVPSFTSTATSTAMSVAFPNHGLLVGQPFVVEVQTTVGGVNLLGPYPVTAVTDANNFSFTAPYSAGSSETVGENGDDTSLATAATIQGLTQSAYPVDIVLYPLSRGDYFAISIKQQQGRPTSFWDDRLISNLMYMWPVPDANGPYELRYKASRQVEDADLAGGTQMAIPYRFLEAFAADLAAHISMKFAPNRTAALAAYALDTWTMAANEDRERVSSFLTPQMDSYYH